MRGGYGQAWARLKAAISKQMHAMHVIQVEGLPGEAGANPEITITWTDEFPTQITKSIVTQGATQTYVRYLTWTGGMLTFSDNWVRAT